MQGADGGWGQDGGGASSARTGGAAGIERHDVASTAVAALALMHAGRQFEPHVERALTFVACGSRRVQPTGWRSPIARGTQIQRKLGPYIDTFLSSTLMSRMDGRASTPALNARVRQALQKTVAKIEKHQQLDGSWNIAGGWAPVLGTSMASRPLRGSKQRRRRRCGRLTACRGLHGSRPQRSRVTPARRTGDGLSVAGGPTAAPAEAAGVPLYQGAQALEQLSRTAADRAQNARQIRRDSEPARQCGVRGRLQVDGRRGVLLVSQHQRQHEARRRRCLVEMACGHRAEDSRPAEQRRHMGRSPLHHGQGGDDECGDSEPHGRSCALTGASSLAATAAAACSEETGAQPARAGRAISLVTAGSRWGLPQRHVGLLRSGQSLTPFVLGALLRVPNATTRAGRRGRCAIAFIRRHTSADGTVGRTGGDADYPNYATALAVDAMVTAQRSWTGDIAPMVARLRAEQFGEANGWTPNTRPTAAGEWGDGSSSARRRPCGLVHDAVRARGAARVRCSRLDPAATRARMFYRAVAESRRRILLSPVMPALNKAGQSADGFVSATARPADGVLALRASGLPDSDDRIASAIEWLDRNHQPDLVPGFDERASPQQSWCPDCASTTPPRFPACGLINPFCCPEQVDDGSFRNANGRVKEDDPLIATAFAIHVLTRARS